MNKQTWENFVDSKVKDFFESNDLVALNIKDDNGNKAKLKLNAKTGTIKIENAYEKNV